MANLTNAQMQTAINAGKSVMYRGESIDRIADLPSDNQIVIDNAADVAVVEALRGSDTDMVSIRVGNEEKHISVRNLLKSGSVGKSAAYLKTTNGAQTLLAAEAYDRIVILVVEITTTFDAGDGAVPNFDLGETSTTNKFKNDLNSGTAGDQLIYAGTLSATKALLITGTAATGTTSTGAIKVTAIVLPLSA